MSLLSKLFNTEKSIELIKTIPKLKGISIVLDSDIDLSKYKNIIYISDFNPLDLEETTIRKYNAKESLYLSPSEYSKKLINWIDYYITHNYYFIFDLKNGEDKNIYLPYILDTISEYANVIILSDKIDVKINYINNIILRENKYDELSDIKIPKINKGYKVLIKF